MNILKQRLQSFLQEWCLELDGSNLRMSMFGSEKFRLENLILDAKRFN